MWPHQINMPAANNIELPLFTQTEHLQHQSSFRNATIILQARPNTRLNIKKMVHDAGKYRDADKGQEKVSRTTATR